MKKILFSLLIVAALYGCKKEENVKSASLAGQWHLQADTLTIYQNGIVTPPLMNGATDLGFTDMEFYTNGQFSVNDYRTYLGYLTWSQDGNKLTLNYPAAISKGPDLMPKVEYGTILTMAANRMVVRFESFTDSSKKTGYVTTRDFVKLK